MAVRQRVDAVLLDPALGIEGGERCLVQMYCEDLVAFALKPVYSVLERSLAEKGLLVVLVADLFLCDNLGGALCFLYVFVALEQDGVHLGAQADDLQDWLALALVLHLADALLVKLAVKGVVLGIVTCVVKFVPKVFHVLVDILRLCLCSLCLCRVGPLAGRTCT